ncbi:hypothetical protein D187_009555 [Cystobacter fuscus DSM 2262]|uniref:Uncharacterized protein n=1 Tax=Cystobacter fuscus (strain ATCC 25194 / DSM 2262 / NBRC 100088 / M29) TaxID=1242864 RepID=S9Q1A8_CYSF2|nr:hypothetical protein [Cystobacter fuscus]EPX55049.1 hypothetical protein D187_009555 [Cystobacter fuscus DSM 2262]
MAPSPGPGAARTRERFREFLPPELIDVAPPGEDEDGEDEATRERPRHLRLVRSTERVSEPVS